MIRDLKNIYAAVESNRIVAFDTNLKDFLGKFGNIETELRNYQYFYRELQKNDSLELVIGDKTYLVQRIPC